MTFGMLDGPAYDHTAYDSLDLVPRGRVAARRGDRAGAGAPARRRRPLAAARTRPGLLRRRPAVFPVSYTQLVRAAVRRLAAGALRRRGRRGRAPRLLTLRGVAWAASATGATLGASLLVVASSGRMYRTAYRSACGPPPASSIGSSRLGLHPARGRRRSDLRRLLLHQLTPRSRGHHARVVSSGRRGRGRSRVPRAASCSPGRSSAAALAVSPARRWWTGPADGPPGGGLHRPRRRRPRARAHELGDVPAAACPPASSRA